MKLFTITALSLTVITACFLSCHSTKKGASTETTTAKTASAPTPTLAAAPTLTTSAMRNGVIPGELELLAIKTKYPDVTAQTLDNGHGLYIGKCTDCHRKKNIFVYDENRWKEIIDDMAPRSKLTAAETDDLYKYILAMKATQNSYPK